MGIILWLVIGGVVGWLASIVMRRDGSPGSILNIVVGIVGALLGGWLISPLVGAGTGDFGGAEHRRTARIVLWSFDRSRVGESDLAQPGALINALAINLRKFHGNHFMAGDWGRRWLAREHRDAA